MMATTHAQCVPSTFQAPMVFGAQITTISANLVTNFTSFIPAKYLSNTPAANATDVTFCNVTVSYTHPGQSDNITVMAWLPVGTWNERMEGVGGGGWVAGGTDTPQSYIELVGAIGSGYAGITTDAGLNLGLDQSASPWALLSPGNVNLYDLENLASRSLYDEAIIGKSLIKDFYGRPPKRSYWNGCSQGGRQGMMIAQRYPGLYDGIAAAAPAINWNAFFTAMYWPQLIMDLARKYPHGCELDAITAAAVSACDGLDGVIDGVISNVNDCHFNPFKVVGSVFNCSATGTKMHVSEIAAVVANATWSGPATSTGKFLWYGPHIGADISGSLTSLGTAGTNCTGGTCTGAPLYLGAEWITLFIEKNPNFDLTNMTRKQYDEIVHSGNQQFASIIETVDPDLSQFRASKGKILTYHGLADPVIPTRGTQHYYESVTALDPKVHDFYRLFFAPGIEHCNSGPGGQPLSVLEALVEWVENDIAPDSLPVSFQTANGTTFHQILCPYPLKSVYKRGGDPTVAASYMCA